MELLANPKAMKALRDARAGRTRYLPREKTAGLNLLAFGSGLLRSKPRLTVRR
ncbi:hypothetical protein OpiT1DRAFT_02650 [Opitutaceae bacterium TAV1]|nr:hypothetical protein OpiT1DRAFT_02650 [Opitutaceae bacterium TAV1]